MIFNQDNPDGFQPVFKNDNYTIEPHISDYADVRLGSNHLFVMGDNRYPGASHDSRSSLGPINLDDVIGTLWIKVPTSNGSCG